MGGTVYSERGNKAMLCVIAKIDAASRMRLAGIQRIAEDFGIPVRELYGHITLATYLGEEEEAFVASCKASLLCRKAFPVRYDQIEVLDATSIIVASPRKEGDLAAIHGEIERRWGAHFNHWTQGEAWYPHTTLLYKPQTDLSAIAAAMEQTFAPFDAWVERIEFSRVHEDGYEILDAIDLEMRR